MKKVSILVFSILLLINISNADETSEKVKEIGENVSKQLLKTLKHSLMKSITQNGLYGAVQFCSKNALSLTKQVEKKIDNGITIKRTSLKFRNPLNKPDKYEKEVLLFFEKSLKKGEKLPSYYIQVINENGKKYYRYYKPLKVKGLCLSCHGNPDKMDKKLLKTIKQLYPNDKATGYKLNDFRGVIRVSIPANLVEKR